MRISRRNKRTTRPIWNMLSSSLLLFASNIAYADAPFFTDDTQVMDTGHAQGILYTSNETSKIMNGIKAPAFEFDYGILPRFEIDSYFPVTTNINAEPILRKQFPNQTGLGDISFEFKYLLLKETLYLPALSFGPNVYLPTGNANRGLGNGRLWYYIPISAQKTWGDWTTYGEIAYAINSAPTCKNYPFAGWVVQKKINETITLGAEMYSQGASTTFSPAYTLINLGGYYTLTKHASLLASVGHSIIGQPDWAGYLGIAWS